MLNRNVGEWHSGEGNSRLALTGWFLTVALCLFTVENLWIDKWARSKLHYRVPSLVPPALGGTWMAVCSAIVIAVVLLVVSQILMWRISRAPTWRKAMRTTAAVVALLLCGAWFVSTSGMQLSRTLAAFPQRHSVFLQWKPSPTPNVKYNVYRSNASGLNYKKLNDKPQSELTYTDRNVTSGMTYYYVVRSTDDKGNESYNSPEAAVEVP